MFGKKADEFGFLAKIAADALLGNLKLGAFDKVKLATSYTAFLASPEAKRQAIDRIAQELAERAPDVAARLCDALAERVGK
jgi:hypothetical protein